MARFTLFLHGGKAGSYPTPFLNSDGMDRNYLDGFFPDKGSARRSGHGQYETRHHPSNYPERNPPNPTRKENKFHSKENKVPSERNPKRIRRESNLHLPSYPKVEKWPLGTVVELNSADTTALKKVPGIGSVFAKRIIKYRELLGGFYSVEQLGEVYGIDEERYKSMKSWFSADLSAISQLPVNLLSAKELARHPYVSYKQARVIERQVRKKGKLQGWENLALLEEFTEYDRERLRHYFSFQ